MSSTLFNWSLYGAMVHHLRKRKGIKNIDDLPLYSLRGQQGCSRAH